MFKCTVTQCVNEDSDETVMQQDTNRKGTSKAMAGHSLDCHDKNNLKTFENKTNCQDPLLTLLRLQEHFPQIRTLVRRIYELKAAFKSAEELQFIFEKPVEDIYKVYLKYKDAIKFGKNVISINRPNVDIQAVLAEFHREFEKLQKRNDP